MIAIDRIRDEIYIPIGGKGIGEILVEEIRSLLGLERAELETISRHTGRLDWIGKGVGPDHSVAVERRTNSIEHGFPTAIDLSRSRHLGAPPWFCERVLLPGYPGIDPPLGRT